MGFWESLKKSIFNTCVKYGEEYEDVCITILEDINQYKELTKSVKSKLSRRRE